MTLRITVIALLSIFLAGCGSSSKGPGQIVSPPAPPPPSGLGPPPNPNPVPPRIPGFGNNGKLSLQVEQGGSVSTDPDLGTCGGPAICDSIVPRGTVVTLTARAEPGWAFEEWEFCDGPSGLQCVVTIDALKYVKAEFEPAR